MIYNLLIRRSAQKELSRLPVGAYHRIKSSILKLANNPRPRGTRKLSGREGWRIRVRELRVVYEIDDSNHSVTVLHIGHRRDVYR